MSSKTSKKDIAIVGISGRFPKSKDVQEFWRNLEKSEELIDFYTKSELADLNMPQEKIDDPNFIGSSSRIDDPESFDHAFFGYTREEAAIMDPQIRILHEQVWKGLDDAGYNPERSQEKIGCFFSASDNLNWRTHVMLSDTPNVSPFFANSISNITSISRLISYSLDLKGPSYFLDTACSSSLVAIHLACRNLMLKECSMAVAGGVSISSSTELGYQYETGSIFSKDGHCRAFDENGSGTLSGEGVGVVVLKRLEDALNSNDHIYAVIKSTAVNNDGKGKVGYTAPSVQGQYECIRLAQQIAGVEPSDIGYIEAHGTGTNLGDPIEIEALNKAFNYDTSHTCAIGSVKTNMGHLDAAAGVAGVIKTALVLYHKSIPASLHFNKANPKINFDSGPFHVNTELNAWNSDQPLIAGVSSFGIGGTNVHAILQEPPEPDESDRTNNHFQIIPLAAQTKSSIIQFKQSLASYFQENPKANIADVSYSLLMRRNNYRYKDFFIVNEVGELKDLLDSNNAFSKTGTLNDQRVVFMFAGQGSQYFQMGKQMYERFPFYRSSIDEGLSILKEHSRLDYAAVLGYQLGEKLDIEKINETVYTQPLLFLVMYSYAKLLIHLGIRPSQMIGHSLGEYVAACVGEVFTFEQGLKLILKRAELMNSLEGGTMLHVQLSSSEMKKRLPENVSIAAVNTKDSCVISGNSERIAKVSEELKSEQIIVIPLATSHAFHSEMMDDMLGPFREAFTDCTLAVSKIPFVSTRTGKVITEQEMTSPEYWVTHLRETVVFAEALNTLVSQGFSTFVEIGASKTLGNFLRNNEKVDSSTNIMTVSRHPKEKLDDTYYFLTALGNLWKLGVSINWLRLFEGQRRNKLVLPGYAFDKVLFQARVNPIQQLMHQFQVNGTADLSDLIMASADMENSTENETDSDDLTPAVTVEKPELTANYAEPNTDTEKTLVQQWEALFGYSEIGIHDDFFELGGDSLKALTLLRRIHQEFKVEIRVEDFFDGCSIHVLANEIDLAKGMSQLSSDEKKSSNSEQLRF